MSIINDALKKTQIKLKGLKRDEKQEIEQTPAPKEPEITNVYEKMYEEKQIKANPTSVQVNPEKKSSQSKSQESVVVKTFKLMGALAFLVVSLYICFLIVSRYKPVKNFIHTVKSKSRTSQFRTVAPAPKRAYKTGDLILNGTSFIDGNRAALINDEIYEVGDTVNGKTITVISSESVELQNDQEIITIKVR